MRYARLNDGVATRIFSTDIRIPESAEVVEAPDTIDVGWSVKDGAWTKPKIAALPIGEARLTKSAEMALACQTEICSGFVSSATGAARRYPSLPLDQDNLVQAAMSSSGGALWRQDESGWAFAPHSQGQAAAVLSDFVFVKDAARSRLAGINARIDAAKKSADVLAIVWESGV